RYGWFCDLGLSCLGATPRDRLLSDADLWQGDLAPRRRSRIDRRSAFQASGDECKRDLVARPLSLLAQHPELIADVVPPVRRVLVAHLPHRRWHDAEERQVANIVRTPDVRNISRGQAELK